MTNPGRRKLFSRSVYGIAGVVSLAIGVIGIAVPLIPTTGPVLLAAFFFARSSDRLHSWITAHRRFGPMIKDYQAGLGIPMRAKVTATVMIAVSFGITIAFAVDNLAVRLLLVATAAGVLAFIYTRPTRPYTQASA